jgi:hypothetical protein
MDESETETETETETNELPLNDTDKMELPGSLPVVPKVEGAHIVAAEKGESRSDELRSGPDKSRSLPAAPKIEGSHIILAEKDSENREPDDDSTKARMFCGLEGILFDDGSTDPVGIDFYNPTAGESATCKACLEGWFAAGKPQETAEL